MFLFRLQPTSVVGLFNLLESAFEGAGLEDDAMPRMPGDQFYLSVSERERHSNFAREREDCHTCTRPVCEYDIYESTIPENHRPDALSVEEDAFL